MDPKPRILKVGELTGLILMAIGLILSKITNLAYSLTITGAATLILTPILVLTFIVYEELRRKYMMNAIKGLIAIIIITLSLILNLLSP